MPPKRGMLNDEFVADGLIGLVLAHLHLFSAGALGLLLLCSF